MRDIRLPFNLPKRKNNRTLLSCTFLIIPSTTKKPFIVSKNLVLTLLLIMFAGFGGIIKITVFITSNAIARLSLETEKNNFFRLEKDEFALNDSLTKLIRTFNLTLDTIQCSATHFSDSSNNSAKTSIACPAFVCPAMGRFSSFFGIRADPFYETRTLHHGIDIAGPILSPVLCASNGTVVFAGYKPRFGNVVIIDHSGTGFQSVYAHLFEFSVKRGDTICSGDQIGLLGNTGKSTGPHLHFEIRYFGTPLDPLPFLLPDNVIAD